MRLPDGTVLMHGDLEHRAPYDPRKAHEYYLRTRQLRGRRSGRRPGQDRLQPISRTIGSISVGAASTPPPTGPKKGVNRTQHQQAREFLKSTNARLAELNQQLKTKLANMHQSSYKAPKTPQEKEAAKDKTAPQTPEELKKQISNLNGRLTSAMAKLEKLANAAP